MFEMLFSFKIILNVSKVDKFQQTKYYAIINPLYRNYKKNSL